MLNNFHKDKDLRPFTTSTYIYWNKWMFHIDEYVIGRGYFFSFNWELDYLF